MIEFLANQHDYLHLIFSLALAFLGFVFYAISKEETSAKHKWDYLVYFCAFFCASQLTHIFLLCFGNLPIIVFSQTSSLVISLVLLMEFARNGLNRILTKKLSWYYLVPILLFFLVLHSLSPYMLISHISDYLFFFIAFSLVALLFFVSRVEADNEGRNSLAKISLCFLLLGSVAYLDSSLVVIIKTILAALIASFGIKYLSYQKEKALKSRVLTLKKINIFILTISLIIISGFFLTNYLDYNAQGSLRKYISFGSKETIRNLQDLYNLTGQIAKTLCGSPWILPALTDPNKTTLEQANSVLDRYNSNMNTSVCYLLDMAGDTIASSNRNAPDSFVGKNFSFRPYFKEALKDKPASFAGVGVISRIKGVFSASPVKTPSGKIVGIVVVKKNIEKEVLSFFPNDFIVGKDGIIFVSNPPFSTLRPLYQIDKNTIEKINASRQFDLPIDNSPLFFKPLENNQVVDYLGRSFHVSFFDTGIDDWKLYVLTPSEQILFIRFLMTILFFVISMLIIGYNSAWVERETDRNIIYSEKERLAKILQSINDAVIVTNHNGIITFLNGTAEALTGYNKDEALNRPLKEIFNIFNKDTMKPQPNPVDTVLATDKTTYLSENTLLVSKNNNQIMIADSAVPIHSQLGNISGVVLAFRDITRLSEASEKLVQKLEELSNLKKALLNVNDDLTADLGERKKLQKYLNFQLDFLQTLINSIPNPIFYKDLAGNYLGCNDAFETFFGKKRSEILYKSVFELYPKDEAEFLHAKDLELLENKKAMRYETKVLHADGTEHDVNLDKATFKNPDGSIGGLVGIMQDISDRKKAEEEIQHLYKVKNEFISSVSHELRTPLTSIKEGIGIVLDGSAGEINQGQKDFLSIAKRNVDRLHRLIDDVLDFSKLESGKAKFIFKPGNMGSILEDIYEAEKVSADKKNLFIKIEMEQNLPVISFDKDSISQVMFNLIENAVKFTDHGGITIKIMHDPWNHGIKVGVFDTGPGIKKEEIDRLFQKFEQLEVDHTKKIGGTGLGLAISKQIIENHKGKIWVESEVGKGSAFWFTIPPGL